MQSRNTGIFSLLCSFFLHFPPHVPLTYPRRAMKWTVSAFCHFCLQGPIKTEGKTKSPNTVASQPKQLRADSSEKQEMAPCDAGTAQEGFCSMQFPDTSLTQFTACKPSNWTFQGAIWRSATAISLSRACSPMKTVYWFLLCVQRYISS